MTSFTLSHKLLCVLSLLVALVAAKASPAQVLAQLQKRNPYYGGFAIPVPASGCAKYSGVETCPQGCCPLGTYCGPGGYCCPTTDDCGTAVNSLPTCADPSWTLYDAFFPFCCPPGTVGLSSNECDDPSITFSAEQSATTTVQANTASPPKPTGSLASSLSAAINSLSAASNAAATTTAATTGGGFHAGISVGPSGVSVSLPGKGDGSRVAVAGGSIFVVAFALVAVL